MTFRTLILFIFIVLNSRVYGQIEGTWSIQNSSILTTAEKQHPDSAQIIFKKNGKYRIDIFASNIFPAHRVPWKKYHWGHWKINSDKDTLVLYKNFEKWSLKTERQDFKFEVRLISIDTMEFYGRGLEKLVYYGKTEPYEVDTEFELTPPFTVKLKKKHRQQNLRKHGEKRTDS